MYHTFRSLVSGWHMSHLDYMVAPLLLLGHLLWGRDFLQSRLDTGCWSPDFDQGRKAFKAGCARIQELKMSSTEVCMNMLIPLGFSVSLAAVWPCSVGTASQCQLTLCCGVLGAPGSSTSIGPSCESSWVNCGKVKWLLGHLRRLWKNVGGLSALAWFSLNPLSRANVHSLRGNLACSCVQAN